jgi:hypothetical protein
MNRYTRAEMAVGQMTPEVSLCTKALALGGYLQAEAQKKEAVLPQHYLSPNQIKPNYPL